MIFDIFLDVLLVILTFVISLMPSLEVDLTTIVLLEQAFSLLSNFIDIGVLSSVPVFYFGWQAFFVLYAPISWVINKIPTISD